MIVPSRFLARCPNAPKMPCKFLPLALALVLRGACAYEPYRRRLLVGACQWACRKRGREVVNPLIRV